MKYPCARDYEIYSKKSKRSASDGGEFVASLHRSGSRALFLLLTGFAARVIDGAELDVGGGQFGGLR
ncbi:MAG TPA: hypothetical protein PKD73_12410, partial [Burkholderiaceae bacterium]|nr:hypothetical protein [Burkholderiaceae bacterium]